MADQKINLFVYGSLKDPGIFKSVCGFRFTLKPSKVNSTTLFAEMCLLAGHRRVSPDNVYYYAVPEEHSRIEGLLIRDVTSSAMAEIDRYEGKRYIRETVEVSAAGGHVTAQAYLLCKESMREHFGDRFHVNLIQELWIRKRIEKFFTKHTRPGERTVDAGFERKAKRELLGTTERDLIGSHYNTNVVSDYFIRHELSRPIQSIRHLYDEPEAVPFIKNYLSMVVKQVVLNQFEEKVHSQFRFELEQIRVSGRYYKRTLSLLVALQMVNANRSAIDLIASRCLETMPYKDHDLIDYVKYAVGAAESAFDQRVGRTYLERVYNNFQRGLIPMGVEIELSNLGHKAVSSQSGEDWSYDSFRYYYDFELDVLSWKVGGYIDDHSGSTDRQRRRGFLEFAPGRLSVGGELSRPVTADPWVLSQMLQGIVEFYEVQPHSLHLSFQLRKNQINKQQILPLGFVKCLLVLGGGIRQKGAGKLWISRMARNEIVQDLHGEELVFARTSKRRWYLGADEVANKAPSHSTTYVQQYKFIRLEQGRDYEPLIVCLKGLQLGFNPGDYLTTDQLKSSVKLRREYEELKRWAIEPTAISPNVRKKFLTVIREGLMNEQIHQPSHSLHYIEWVLSAVDVQLRMFNKQFAKPAG